MLAMSRSACAGSERPSAVSPIAAFASRMPATAIRSVLDTVLVLEDRDESRARAVLDLGRLSGLRRHLGDLLVVLVIR